ncbi:unnamed protein product [Cuscuta campestris]|uniref:Uncharacterized protein n=1 Tax=Cuscuta campestris TaxID=132261 RepID=A0A484LZF9_9ASTE|nr:unnamed protein product [Cuscuta campestris]
MAAVKESLPDFSLPSDFFSDSDVFPEKYRKTDTDICFPAEFPYDLCSSPAGSAESDDDEFLSSLTRRLTLSSLPEDTLNSFSSWKNHFEAWLLSGSPEKTSRRERSWSGRSTGTPNGPSQISSPTTPLGFKKDSWDLILQAAGRVAALQMRAGEESLFDHRLPGHRTFPLFSPPPHKARGVGPFVSSNAASLQGRAGTMPYGGAGGPCVGGVKRERSGTGVFLPRPYGNDTSTHRYPMNSGRNKAGFCPNARVVPSTPNNFRDINGATQPRLKTNFVSDYDVMLARRNAALLAQNKKDFRPEVMLPQEWTY